MGGYVWWNGHGISSRSQRGEHRTGEHPAWGTLAGLVLFLHKCLKELCPDSSLLPFLITLEGFGLPRYYSGKESAWPITFIRFMRDSLTKEG